MTQCEKIVQYMRDFGSISTLEAFRDIGCTRLSGRIHDLRRQGYDIESNFETSRNRYGEAVSYKRYRLREGA